LKEVVVISGKERGDPYDPAFSNVKDEGILALLSRRPCTSADVASGLGIHVAEVLKHLDVLLAAGMAKTVVSNGRTFYSIDLSKGDNK